jgi:chemotaxis signal transduction protein
VTGGSCKAWLLPLGEGRLVAIGEYEMVHIIPEWVRLQSIPHCPAYCHKVFMWQGHLIPVFDLQAWLHQRGNVAEDTAQDSSPIICIVAYKDDNRNVSFGGMLLSALPYRCEVYDSQICDYPEEEDRWRSIAVSCFSGPNGMPSPVLDLSRIFCRSPWPSGRGKQL